MDWAHPVRVMIQIADAPPHGDKFHDPKIVDTKKEFDADRQIMKGLLQKMKDLDIAYFFGKILPATDMV